MSGRRHGDARCTGCGLYPQLCLCDQLAPRATSSTLHLLLHVTEAQKPTNSGRLAARMLAGSVVDVVGHGAAAPTTAAPPPPPTFAANAVLLFPGEGAAVLTRDHGPVTLVVPDGTWRQARRLRGRVAGLAALPTVTLPGAQLATDDRLRRETRDGGVSTLEAIAAALRILDGDDVADALLDVYRRFVDRTLWLRGQKADVDVYGGIPALARAYDPRGGIPLPVDDAEEE